MNKLTSSERVGQCSDKRGAEGPHIDTIPADFGSDCRRQCDMIAAADGTAGGQTETEFWKFVSADARDDLGCGG
jgi:hypothetical protein